MVAIDPAPRRRLRALAEAHPELELVRETSHDALSSMELTDAVLIDGDHNYFTVDGDLRRIAERRPGASLPLVLLHDVGWPLGRRDAYFDWHRIPSEHRQPIAERAFLAPDEPGLAERGLYYEGVAAQEGGPGNGVLTAVEDFVADHDDLELAVVAPFFGLAVVWHRDAPWADAVAEAVAPWADNPLLERIERKRIDHLVSEFQNLQRVEALRSADYDLRFELVGKLLPIYDSSAFALAERLSRVRQGGRPNFSRQELGGVVNRLASDDIALDDMRSSGARRSGGGRSRFASAPPDLASEPGT
jgi:hypothetical protein